MSNRSGLFARFRLDLWEVALLIFATAAVMHWAYRDPNPVQSDDEMAVSRAATAQAITPSAKKSG